MNIAQTISIKNEDMLNGGYVSIHDDGEAVERTLYITDDNGNTAILKNAQIGELYNSIKPALAA